VRAVEEHRQELIADLARVREQRDALLQALRDARTAIKVFHGPVAWDIYERSSPEMKRIDAAIAAAEAQP
jgi:hypothetical protein